MNYVDFPEANLTLGKPKDMTDEDCGALRIQAAKDCKLGFPTLTSKWVPTPDELKKLNEGGGVYLTVWSGQHPPVSLSVDLPFHQFQALEGEELPV